MREEDPAQMRQSLEKVQAGLVRLSRVITQILALARNEPEAARRLMMEPVDLNALALEASAYWVPEALKKQIDMGYEGGDTPVLVEGSAARLRELLRQPHRQRHPLQPQRRPRDGARDGCATALHLP